MVTLITSYTVSAQAQVFNELSNRVNRSENAIQSQGAKLLLEEQLPLAKKYLENRWDSQIASVDNFVEIMDLTQLGTAYVGYLSVKLKNAFVCQLKIISRVNGRIERVPNSEKWDLMGSVAIEGIRCLDQEGKEVPQQKVSDSDFKRKTQSIVLYFSGTYIYQFKDDIL